MDIIDKMYPDYRIYVLLLDSYKGVLMLYRLNLKNIENAGKIIVLSYMVLALAFFTIVLFSQISGKNVSIEGNYPFLAMLLGLLANIGILMLIFVSVIEFIRAYREAANK